MTDLFLPGFFLQASLILALGAQNLFVLDCGFKKRFPLRVALVCSLCDLMLIALGVLGAASIFVRIPALKIAFGELGVAFLAYYAILKLREAAAKEPPILSTYRPSEDRSPLGKTLLTALGFSLLNPHVYLDTVVLIGGYSSRYPDLSERAGFGLGAGTFSVIWFFGLAGLASVLGRFLANPRAMRAIALGSGLVLAYLSVKLGVEVGSWMDAG